jgi:acetyltransferase-like isoleucine patch superfamily enzyme
MRETILLLLEKVLSGLKRRPYRMDRRIPVRLLLAILLRRAIWLCRGIAKTGMLQLRPKAIFLAPGVEFRNSSLCRFSKGVTLERAVVIDGLSEYGIVLGENVAIGAYSIIRASSATHIGAGMSVGRNSSCDAYSFFGAGGLITIGENVIMGQYVSFHAETHNHSRIDELIRLQGITPKPIIIEDDCWVGARVTLLGGAVVRQGSIIGAGAVVNKEFPPYSIIAGVPARLLRSRKRPIGEDLRGQQ